MREHRERGGAVVRNAQLPVVDVGHIALHELARIGIVLDDENSARLVTDVARDRVTEQPMRDRLVDPVDGADEAILHLAGDRADDDDRDMRDLR